MDERIDVDKISLHWLNTSERDSKTMNHLFDSGDYHWALFIGHIVLERLLKCFVVRSTL
jgi:HEPN domain-containing protein